MPWFSSVCSRQGPGYGFHFAVTLERKWGPPFRMGGVCPSSSWQVPWRVHSQSEEALPQTLLSRKQMSLAASELM